VPVVYACETWCLVFREKHRLSVFDDEDILPQEGESNRRIEKFV
jgi:hypothetical protein